jgi:fatty-acyl-CoA synthase
MLAYVQGDESSPLLEETIGANFERTVSAHGAREALVESATGRRWTYEQLNADVNDLARALMAAGIEKGDRVGVWAPNCAEWVITQYATAKVGAILVSINPAYRTYELEYALNRSAVTMLISARMFKSSNYEAMIGEVHGRTALRTVVHFGEEWQRLLASATGEEDLAGRMATLHPNDPINIQYTSGTTGAPKGTTLSHRNILNNGFFVAETVRLTHEDRLAIPVPFYHCFGMVMANLGCTSHGAAMIVPGPAFDAGATLQVIQDERCTAVYGVPTMFIAMQSLPEFAEYDLHHLRTGIMAGAPCPVEVMKRCITEMHMAEISICYGMTETSPVSSQTLHDDDFDRRTKTIGRAHPHVEVKIADVKTGATVERANVGEYCTRGYSVMIGYWKDPERTADAIDDEGWMHTGDLAVMHDDGYVQIVGRLKDMVVRGGENIYPREIEEFLYTHPGIEDVAVVGVPDDRFGEELCACIKVRSGSESLDADAVRAFAAGKLAHYKIPKYVRIVDKLPVTVNGKIRKVDVRVESAQALGLPPPSF